MQSYVENKSIAVIGNAQSLFDFQYGSEIDDHEIVIRINNSAIFYDELSSRHSHGTKFDVWAFWDYLRTATMHDSYKTPRMSQYLDSKYNKLDLNMGSKEKPFIFNEEEFGIETKKNLCLETGNPSAGLSVLYLLNTLNPKIINVYGFDFKRTKTFYKEYNDVDNDRYDSFCRHNYKFEEQYAKQKFFTQEKFNLIGEI